MPTSLARTGMYALRALRACYAIRVRKRPAILLAEWNITFRCNLRCKYCGACDARREEWPADKVLRGLDGLWAMGVRWITFGGGEPLMRPDLGTILRHAHHRGFQTYLSTNGWFVPQRIADLQWVDHVNLSLDGSRSTHDAVRGRGAFDKTIEAIDACRKTGIAVSLQCVLAAHNFNEHEEAVQIAAEHGVTIMFQPATQWLDSSLAPNPLAPPVEPYRETISRLIEMKRRGAPIRNSIEGLRHLRRWPDPSPIWCSAGVLTCSIEPDGTLLACHQADIARFLRGRPNTADLTEQARSIVIPRGCAACWCAPMVELALIFSLRREPILNLLKTMR